MVDLGMKPIDALKAGTSVGCGTAGLGGQNRNTGSGQARRCRGGAGRSPAKHTADGTRLLRDERGRDLHSNETPVARRTNRARRYSTMSELSRQAITCCVLPANIAMRAAELHKWVDPLTEEQFWRNPYSLRQQRRAPGAAPYGQSELLHWRAVAGDRLRAEPRSGIHGNAAPVEGRSAAQDSMKPSPW